MTSVLDRAQDLFDSLTEPRPPRPQSTPAPRLMRIYLAMIVVSLVALLAIVWWVVIPGVRAQQSSAPVPAVSAPPK